MNAGTPKTGAWRGVVVVRHFVALRDEVTHRLSAGREDRGFWRRLTVTRQQSRTSLQAAARKVKGADVVTGAGWNRFRHGAALTRDLAQVPSRYSFSSLVPNVSIAR